MAINVLIADPDNEKEEGGGQSAMFAFNQFGLRSANVQVLNVLHREFAKNRQNVIRTVIGYSPLGLD